MLLSTRSAPDSATSRTRPSGPASTSPPVQFLGGAGGGVGVGERDPGDAALDRLLDQRECLLPADRPTISNCSGRA